MDSIKDILKFAIDREEEAANFYSHLAEKAKFAGLKSVLKEFEREEWGHKKKLEQISAGAQAMPLLAKINDLKIADYTIPVKIAPDMSYQDILIVAMKREKASFRLYTDLASRAADTNIQGIFKHLAQEEAKHKLRFETEDDAYIMAEN